jgi:hypothetical protein
LIKKQEKLFDFVRKKYDKYASLFFEFEYEKGKLKLLYYPYFFFRRLVMVFTFYGLSDIPEAQVLISVIFSMILAFGLWKINPFQVQLLNRLCIFNEITFIMILSLMGSFLLSPTGESNSTLQYFTISLVSLSVLCQFIVVVYSCVKAYQASRNEATSKTSVVPETLVTKPENFGKSEKLFQGTLSSSYGLENLTRQAPYSPIEQQLEEKDDPVDNVHNVSERISEGSLSFNELSENTPPSQSQSIVQEIFKNNYARYFDEEDEVRVEDKD